MAQSARLSRRSFLLGLGAVGAVALQGCSVGVSSDSDAALTGSAQPVEVVQSTSSEGTLSGSLDLKWSALLLRDPGVETSTDEEPLSEMALGIIIRTSNLVTWRQNVLVGAGGALLMLDATAGDVIHRFELAAPDADSPMGDVGAVAAEGNTAYLATSGGYFVAIDLVGEEQLWASLVCPARSTGWLAQDADGAYEDLPGAWLCPALVVHDGALVTGFSSYQLENTSTLACVEAATGAIRWTRQLEGRLDTAGGIGYPVAVDDGILLPMPDGTGLGLLSWQTGETLDLLETDGEIYMGLTMSEDGGLPGFFQSRLGTLYRVEAADGALVASSVQDACTEATKRVPSGARPLLVDGRVYVNAATQDEDADRFDGDCDPSAGECVTFDARTLEVLERHDAPEIESSPICTGDSVFYLGRAGIYRATLADGVLGEPELVFDGEGRDRDVWDQQLLIMDDTLFFVGGPFDERWLYAVG